jgi:glucokinase
VATKATLLLAGDVGGTKVNLALFEQKKGGELVLIRNKRYPSADYGSLNEIVVKFLAKTGDRVHGACLGVPGVVRNNRALPTNLKWEIDGASLGDDLKTSHVVLINDLHANAAGIAEMSAADLETLQEGLVAPVGNRCIISPGTGLGEAGLFWDGERHWPWASEGGHANFAPRSDVEIELLSYLQSRFGHVSIERVASGQGIPNIYAFLRDSGHGTERLEILEAFKKGDPGEVIAKAAEDGSCPMCSQTIEIFAHALANEAANLALKTMATGGVYFGGGIPAKLLWKLRGPAFIADFNAKGRLESLMESMPVKVVLNDQAALLGAARVAADSLID